MGYQGECAEAGGIRAGGRTPFVSFLLASPVFHVELQRSSPFPLFPYPCIDPWGSPSLVSPPSSSPSFMYMVGWLSEYLSVLVSLSNSVLEPAAVGNIQVDFCEAFGGRAVGARGGYTTSC